MKHLGQDPTCFLRQTVDQTLTPKPAPHYEVVVLQKPGPSAEGWVGAVGGAVGGRGGWWGGVGWGGLGGLGVFFFGGGSRLWLGRSYGSDWPRCGWDVLGLCA